MTDLELIITMLGEAATTKITVDRDSQGVPALKKDAHEGERFPGRRAKISKAGPAFQLYPKAIFCHIKVQKSCRIENIVLKFLSGKKCRRLQKF